jgi:hypothetical protein
MAPIASHRISTHLQLEQQHWKEASNSLGEVIGLLGDTRREVESKKVLGRHLTAFGAQRAGHVRRLEDAGWGGTPQEEAKSVSETLGLVRHGHLLADELDRLGVIAYSHRPQNPTWFPHAYQDARKNLANYIAHVSGPAEHSLANALPDIPLIKEHFPTFLDKLRSGQVGAEEIDEKLQYLNADESTRQRMVGRSDPDTQAAKEILLAYRQIALLKDRLRS